MPNAKSVVVLTAVERATLAELRRAAGGIFRASARVGVSRDTFERAGAGLGVRRGSAALIRAALAELDHPPSALPEPGTSAAEAATARSERAP